MYCDMDWTVHRGPQCAWLVSFKVRVAMQAWLATISAEFYGEKIDGFAIVGALERVPHWHDGKVPNAKQSVYTVTTQ